MMPGGGSYGGAKYSSPTTKALGSITVQSYQKVYDDQGKFMSKLAGDVSFLAANGRKQQAGIDKANENFIQQTQDMINDIIVLLGGGGDTGFDWGDLRYVIIAIGAMFGFTDGSGKINVPINLFQAAWHFFSNYLLPVDNFKDAIDIIVDELIATAIDIFGEVPIAGQAIEQWAVIMSDLRDIVDPLLEAWQTFLGIFTIDIGDTSATTEGITNYFGPLKPIFDMLGAALDGINLPDFTPVFHRIALWTEPFTTDLDVIIQALIPMITSTASFGGVLTPLLNIISPLIDALAPYIDQLVDVALEIAPIIDLIVGVINLFTGVLTFPTDFDPTDVIGHFITTYLNPSGLLEAVLDPLSTVNASQIVGTLLGSVIPNLDIGKINTLPGLLSTMFSPFNPPQVVGPGQITLIPQNLLKNWNFPDANSLAGETVWVWDAINQAASGGSAKVLANINTNTKALQSDPIQVAAKDTINTSAWTQWNSLAYTGAPISLKLNLYNASNTLIDQITLATATMTGATSSWVQLAGSYVIPDASTAVWARLVYNVANTATTGSVWFTNGSFTKPNPIPQTAVQNLTGILGGVDVAATIQDFVDAGVQGIVNDFGTLTGQSLAAFNQQISNMARFLGFVTSGAAPQNSVAQIASNVDNTVKARAVQKAFNENIDPTTDAVFPLSQVWQNATLPVVASTAGATVMGDITIRDGGDKNAVTWYGYPAGGNFGSISDFRVNVWSINKTTNVRTKVHGSINLIGSATPPGTGSAPVFNSYNLPASIPNIPGDRLTVEIAILGAGTYYLVGQSISPQLPFHSVYGLHGLTRASAAAPTTVNPPGVGGSPLSYSRSIPWIGMSGVQSATQYTPVTIPYYGNDSFNPALYTWANYMDIIVCGPGGRGADGSGYWGGNAGHPGGWGYYAGLPKSVWGAVTTSISITGGASQAASSITVPGWGTISGPAGANEASVQATSNLGYPGGGPGDVVVNGQFYPGGQGGATAQASGSTPGGAGAGGNAPFTVGSYIYGGNGGNGIAYLRLYQ
jgi:hypothetical protein